MAGLPLKRSPRPTRRRRSSPIDISPRMGTGVWEGGMQPREASELACRPHFLASDRSPARREREAVTTRIEGRTSAEGAIQITMTAIDFAGIVRSRLGELPRGTSSRRRSRGSHQLLQRLRRRSGANPISRRGADTRASRQLRYRPSAIANRSQALASGSRRPSDARRAAPGPTSGHRHPARRSSSRSRPAAPPSLSQADV